MATGSRADGRRFGLPVTGTLSDVPRFDWRGIHLDVARTFYEVEDVLRLADLAAWLKLNVLHLHLNDDEGWRIAVDGYPDIARVAAWRGHGLPLPALLGSGPEPYGGTYSAEDISRISAHCLGLGITLLPEIDLPGHGYAAMTAIPSLREPGDMGGYHSVQGFEGNALHPLLPETATFVSAAIASTLRMFDGPAVHIGGDEVGPETWSGSPSARAAAGDGPTGALQSVLLDLGHRLVTDAGRKTIVWEDAIHNASFDPERTIAVVWQHPDRAFELAERGHDVVLAPGNAYYLDMAYSDAWESTGGHWAGTVPLDKTYGFEAGHGWPTEQLSRLRGVHACIWGEHMQDRRNFDDLVFPRIYAFAERAWIEPANRDFEGLCSRLGAFPHGLTSPARKK
jgi:hexosaminidase